MARPRNEKTGHRSSAVLLATTRTAPRASFRLPGPRPESRVRNVRDHRAIGEKKKDGSPSRARTCDNSINSRMLYQLSYRGMTRRSRWQAYSKPMTALPTVCEEKLFAPSVIISLKGFIRSFPGPWLTPRILPTVSGGRCAWPSPHDGDADGRANRTAIVTSAKAGETGQTGRGASQAGSMKRSTLNDADDTIRREGGGPLAIDNNSPKRRSISIFGRRMPLPASRGGRVTLGLALVLGGILGFLPILGLWMLPLGFLVLSVDFIFVRRWRRRLGVKWGRWRRHSGSTEKA